MNTILGAASTFIGGLLVNAYWLVVPVILVACFARWYFRGSDQRLLWTLLGLAGTLVSNRICGAYCQYGVSLRPDKLDRFIYAIDGLLGFQASFVVGQIVKGWPFIKMLLLGCYYFAPFAMLAVFYGYLWLRSKEEAVEMLPVLVSNVAVGLLLYMLVPVSGPRYAFPSFPAMPLEPVSIAVMPIDGPPNGIPSLHFSTAVLILWYARKLPHGTFWGALFMLATMAATLGLGEHYLFDLVVSLPYTVVVYRLGIYLAARIAKPQAEPSHASVR